MRSFTLLTYLVSVAVAFSLVGGAPVPETTSELVRRKKFGAKQSNIVRSYPFSLYTHTADAYTFTTTACFLCVLLCSMLSDSNEQQAQIVGLNMNSKVQARSAKADESKPGLNLALPGTINLDVALDEENPEADIEFLPGEEHPGVDIHFLPGPLVRPIFNRFR